MYTQAGRHMNELVANARDIVLANRWKMLEDERDEDEICVSSVAAAEQRAADVFELKFAAPPYTLAWLAFADVDEAISLTIVCGQWNL